SQFFAAQLNLQAQSFYIIVIFPIYYLLQITVFILFIIGWEYVQASSDISQCLDGVNQVSVYGALNFGENTLINKNFDLPPHYSITLNFNFWIQLWSSLIYSQNYCGNLELDGYQKFTFTANHINSKATIIITSNLDQLASIVHFNFKSSWGIRDFSFSFQPCPIQCIQCQDSTSICNTWQFEMEFWTSNLLLSSEGRNYNIGSFQQFQCIGQEFLKIFELGDYVSNTLTLKPYYQVRIQFQLLKVGQYLNEEIQFQINSVLKYQQVFNNELYYAQCNAIQTDADMIQNVSIDALYSEFNSNSQTVQFQSNILSSNTFYGIRDFYIFIGPCIQNCLLCTTQTDCSQCELDFTFDGVKCQKNLKIASSQSISEVPDWSYTTNQQMQCGIHNIYSSNQQQNVVLNLRQLLFHNQIILRFFVVAIDEWNINNIFQSDSWLKINMIIQILHIHAVVKSEIKILIVDHYSADLVLNFYLSNPSIKQQFGILKISIDYYYCGPKFHCSICDPIGVQCLSCSDATRMIANNCECLQGSSILSSICPDCNQQGPQTQVYCPQVDYCFTAVDGYLPCCLNNCISGYTMDVNQNQCEKNTPNLLDDYPVLLIGQYYNTQTFSNTLSWIVLNDINNIPISNPIGICGQQNLLGGVGFKGKISMNLNNMPPFRRIKIKYFIIFIDI
ncbi:hypothetical protein pb186bvf_006898, partial [Paramecium bursaria]